MLHAKAIIMNHLLSQLMLSVPPFAIGGVISGRFVAAFVGVKLLPATILLVPAAVVFPLLLPILVLEVNVTEIVGNCGTDDNEKDAELPRSLAGIADPTPLLVNGVGKGSVEVFGGFIRVPL